MKKCKILCFYLPTLGIISAPLDAWEVAGGHSRRTRSFFSWTIPFQSTSKARRLKCFILDYFLIILRFLCVCYVPPPALSLPKTHRSSQSTAPSRVRGSFPPMVTGTHQGACCMLDVEGTDAGLETWEAKFVGEPRSLAIAWKPTTHTDNIIYKRFIIQ